MRIQRGLSFFIHSRQIFTRRKFHNRAYPSKILSVAAKEKKIFRGPPQAAGHNLLVWKFGGQFLIVSFQRAGRFPRQPYAAILPNVERRKRKGESRRAAPHYYIRSDII